MIKMIITLLLIFTFHFGTSQSSETIEELHYSFKSKKSYLSSVPSDNTVNTDYFFSDLKRDNGCPSEHDGTLWIFGRDGIVLNFESGSPVEEDNVFIGDFITDFRSDEPSIIELDSNGDLLFYSDNDNIYNRNHVIMENGNPLKGSQTTSQMISVKQPGSDGIYYVFMPEDVKNFDASLDSLQSLYYNIVDMNGDGGLGSVTVKDEFLMEFASEKISAVRHCNGIDWWIVTHQAGNDHFHSYLLNENGLDATPIISAVGDTLPFIHPKAGMIKFSIDGSLLSMTSLGKIENGIKFNGTTEIFKFDNSTGLVFESIFRDTSSMRSNYGIEYSPNGKYLYISDTRNKFSQYDISSLDSATIKESEIILYDYDPDNSINIGALQLGPDNKIYAANVSDSSLHIIHDPDKKGLACNFEPFGLKLKNGESFLGLPNFPANVYRQEYPFISGTDAIDLCQDSTASYYATGRCTIEDYTWELIGSNQITNTTGDSTEIIATVQSRDILVLTRTTACGVYRDSMVVDVTDCNFECNIDFTWVEIDSIICEGDVATLQYSSNVQHITLGHQIYNSDSFSISGLTTDTCINITATYDAFCDTSFIQCFQVMPGIQYDQLSFENIVCRGNTSTLTYNTDADTVELLDESSNLISVVDNGMITTPPIQSDTTFYLRLSRFGDNCEYILPLDIYIDQNVNTQIDTIYTCVNDSFTVNDSIIMMSGLYTWSLSTDDNCDSLYQLEVVHFQPSPIDSIITYTCDASDTLTVWSTFTDINGCETQRLEQIKLNPISITNLQAFTCDADSIGIDTIILSNSFNCDSLVITSNLWIPPSTSDTLITLCSGDSLLLEDKVFTEFGTYEFISSSPSQSGCDSTVFVFLDYYPTSTIHLDTTLCFGDSIMINDVSYNTTGSYEILLPDASVQMCDSIIILDLSVLSFINKDTLLQACIGETIHFFGETIDEQNPETTISIPYYEHSCDSIIYHVSSEFHEVNLNVEIFDPLCDSELGSLTLDLQQDITTVFIDTNIIDLNTNIIDNLSPGNYTLAAQDIYGCTDTLELQIFGSEDLIIDHPDTLFLESNDQAHINLNSNLDLSSIDWSLDNYNCETLDCSTISFIPQSQDPITAIVTSIDGCIDTLSIQVILENDLTFPLANIFSPNNDDINDNWILDFSNSNLIPIDIVIFDRWANKVYEATFQNKSDILSWDGRLNGQKVVNGVYVYYFRYCYQNEEQYKGGTITIVD